MMQQKKQRLNCEEFIWENKILENESKVSTVNAILKVERNVTETSFKIP